MNSRESEQSLRIFYSNYYFLWPFPVKVEDPIEDPMVSDCREATAQLAREGALVAPHRG